MAITHAFTGTSANGSNNVEPGPGGTVLANHRSILIVGTKVSTMTIVTPTDWNLITSVGGGTGTLGMDTGTGRIAAFYRDGAFTGTQSVQITGGADSSWGVISTYAKDTGFEWDTVAFTSGDDTNTANPYSCTCADNPGWTTEDVIILGIHLPTNSPSAHSASSTDYVMATGITVNSGTDTQRSFPRVGTGTDCTGLVLDAIGYTGTASAAPTIGVTFTGSSNSSGPSIVLRLRQSAATLIDSGAFMTFF